MAPKSAWYHSLSLTALICADLLPGMCGPVSAPIDWASSTLIDSDCVHTQEVACTARERICVTKENMNEKPCGREIPICRALELYDRTAFRTAVLQSRKQSS